MELVNDTVTRVCAATGVSKGRIMSRERSAPVATVRFMVYYILCKHHKLSCSHVGKALGRTHATVMHGIEVAEYWLNPGIRDWDSKLNGEKLTQIINELDSENNEQRDA
jgi:hypothetical protein